MGLDDVYPVRTSKVGCLLQVVAVNTVFSTPDDGRRGHPKHVVILQLLINNTAKVAPRWFFT